jgi:DNA-binding response OmpR family regulator
LTTSVTALGRILIVDDEEPVRDILDEYFAGQGYVVQTAASGVEALAIAGRERPDLVLLDVSMPKMDGVEVLRRLRALHDDLAVIMVTANEDLGVARETLKIGALDYVAKPFDFRYLDRAVTAGLLQAGRGRAQAPPAAADTTWTGLALAVFRAARTMPAGGRTSTGERLEKAVLDAVREAAAGRAVATARCLDELELLLTIAEDLGDLSPAARSAIDESLKTMRLALTGP